MTNVGMVGAAEFIYYESKNEEITVRDYYKQTDKFIKISSILSFVHHCMVMMTILGLIAHNPWYFDHWTCPKFILNNYDGYFYYNKYEMAGGIIGLGLFGCMSTFILGAKGLRLAE